MLPWSRPRRRRPHDSSRSGPDRVNGSAVPNVPRVARRHSVPAPPGPPRGATAVTLSTMPIRDALRRSGAGRSDQGGGAVRDSGLRSTAGRTLGVREMSLPEVPPSRHFETAGVSTARGVAISRSGSTRHDHTRTRTSGAPAAIRPAAASGARSRAARPAWRPARSHACAASARRAAHDLEGRGPPPHSQRLSALPLRHAPRPAARRGRSGAVGVHGARRCAKPSRVAASECPYCLACPSRRVRRRIRRRLR
jgi:hypothetical protein